MAGGWDEELAEGVTKGLFKNGSPGFGVIMDILKGFEAAMYSTARP